jgi:alpha-ketoglutarate-dependent taurine dioxygenase
MSGRLDKIKLMSRNGLPLLIEPDIQGMCLTEAFPEIKILASENLNAAGAILFRGFSLADAPQFEEFAGGFGSPLLRYDFGSTPRSTVVGNIYTSTEYPASQSIPLHNEQSYTREWAMRLWFYCVTPAQNGGTTPIADSREILRRIRPSTRERFIEKGLMYVRNYGNGLDVPWQKVFNTNDRKSVEAFCVKKGISCEWKSDGELRTRQICQVIERHPVTGQEVWFNQAHLFHISGLSPELREMLLAVVGPDDLPRNAYYRDGSPIESDLLDEIRTVLRETAVEFPWQAQDVMMIDNMLIAHGRTPYKGARKVLVAMAGRHSNLDQEQRK